MTNRAGWRFELASLSAIVLIASLCGLWFNGFFAALSIGLLAYVSWHLYHLTSLLARLERRLDLPTRAPGLWGEVYGHLAHANAQTTKYRTKHKRLRRLFYDVANTFPGAVAIIRAKGKLNWYNRQASLLFGLDWPPSAEARITVASAPTLREYLARGHFSRPLEIESPSDQAIVLSVRISRFQAKRNRYLLVAYDNTHAYHLKQTKHDFIANASHELRTPLTVIAGLLETLASNHHNPQHTARALLLLRQQTTRMQDITTDLMTLSRLEMNSSGQDKTVVDVPELLKRALADALFLSNGQHEITLDADDTLLIHGEQAALYAVFSNLTLNAVRHTPARSRVWLRWWQDARGAHFMVKDDGEGIAARHLARLTERFYRVNHARARDARGTGTGLGLAIVKHGLARHNSVLHIDSKEGLGSTFSCCFASEAITKDAKDNSQR